MPHRKVSLLAAATAVTVVMSVTAAVGPITLFWTNKTRLERNVVESQIESIQKLQSLLVDAETGERGYALTGQDIFLQPYYSALSQLPIALKTLRRVYEGDTVEEQAAVNRLIQTAERKIQHLTKVVQLIDQRGSFAAEGEIGTGEGKVLMDTIREISAELLFDEAQELADLDQKLIANLRWAVVISGTTFLISLLLGRFMYVSMRSAVKRQAESADHAIKASNQLNESLVSLERRNTEIALLADMARLLQTELSQTETLELASTYCEQLLPGSQGEFFLYRNANDMLQRASGWGKEMPTDHELLDPKTCWALRRGRWHMAEHQRDLCCSHYPPSHASQTLADLCLPLMAYGEVLGLLHVRQVGTGAQWKGDVQVAEALAEQTALALANGRMRQVLETQSIKDPLTGLYNRRFMDETLKRELARAERNSASLSVVMIDLDNFKVMNDTYGHSTGDAVLYAVSSHLMQALRASDVACRFGGEELVIILPDCPAEIAAARAEEIRAAIEAMHLTDQGHLLQVTASFGVASTSAGLKDQASLMKAADSALYVAKRAGKNRVESWTSVEHANQAGAVPLAVTHTNGRQA